MKGFVIGILVTAVAFAILAYVLPQFEYKGDAIALIVLAAVFGVVNALIKPVVKLLSFPINMLTLGLFGLVVNGLLLLLAVWAANSLFDVPVTLAKFPTEALSVDTVIAAVIGAIVLGLITTVIGLFVHD